MADEPRIYDSRWAKARGDFLRKHPLCVMCKQQGRLEPATVVDHKVQHGLKQALKSGIKSAISKASKLFWDRKNWQGLCKPHHDSTKQRFEKRGYEIGCADDGIPLDPGHHWHRP
ncbi:HNH endonuclease [Pseudomonas sp. GW531-T4]|uniref:HNH endonuclease n=1 Tax=Pseudomonas sp. GW531-T4 TaxID=2075553 RepID=UPI000CD0CEB5|nr:HNH endonuclease [Pseudomonas sp. GW531-T4]POA75363.1 HNH endonuclease [Pseudomonas sp. GW531-T4]